MNTVIKKIDASRMASSDFKEAADFLRSGKLVAFPTETVYGLGGNAYDSTASARIYAAKGRPSDNPLIVHISSFIEIDPLVSGIPDEARALADRFWPGPLTMILNKSDRIPKETTGGLDTVAIRMPSHPIANRLIKEAGIPIAAPSANASGRPSTTKAEHVIEDLNGKIDMIIDGGSSDIGLESTIVDLTVKPALILRPGYITIEMLREVLPDIEYDKAVLKRMRDDS
ncbi:MAG: threonylcarbamoyl-AMP synthase, partial [Lachnospiraceae bacterium]|nr:threonylcarbamoyl-AMP synthase [Lachnospiraceae bacterium]